MANKEIDYPQIIDTAMRGAVRDILRKAQAEGLPGNHHFYISYSTLYPGVKISERLLAKYPEEITIVLQHQFWDFKVEEKQFHVTLSFGGIPEKLTVPFAAMTAFADPSVKFGLQFTPSGLFDDEAGVETPAEQQPAQSESAPEEESGDKIISLDSFRKR